MSSLLARVRTASWLGWQVESNWADPFLFIVYSVVRPLATSMILAGMYWAVSGRATQLDSFAGLYLANAFHIYVVQVVVGLGWVVVEDREDFETLKYVYTSPIGMFTYLFGRSTVRLTLATVSMVLALSVGWFALGVRWNWLTVPWAAVVPTFLVGLVACVCLGFVVAGMALVLPRIAVVVNEGVALGLYLLCGVIFPIDLLPRGLQELTLLLPFTYWYEGLRRFLLGEGASTRLSAWSDGTLFVALLASTVAFAFASRWGYLALERRARQLGRLDQTTMF